MRQRTKGFTIIDILILLIIGLVLVALAIPAVMGVQNKANQKKCQVNLREQLVAFQLYLDDIGAIPPPGAGKVVFAQFVTSKILDIKQCYCPVGSHHVGESTAHGILGGALFGSADKARDPISYTPVRWDGIANFGYCGRSREHPLDPAQLNPAATPFAMCDPVSADGVRHDGQAIYCFCDGHTEVSTWPGGFVRFRGPHGEIDLSYLSDYAGWE